MTLKKLNVGIIGYGMIGKVHAFAHVALPFYASDLPVFGQIKKVVTAHESTAERAKDLTGAEGASTDFRFVTEDPEIDIVHICTPNDQHLAPLLSAIDNKKNIYCDKPMVLSKEEADQVFDRIMKTNYRKTSQMTFHLRFYSAIRCARQLIEEGRLGRLLQYRAGYYHASNVSPTSVLKWKQGLAGGVIRDIASHVIDLIDSLIGAPYEVFADSMIAHPIRQLPNAESLPPDQREVPIVAEDSITILTHHHISNGQDVKGIIEATKLATGYEDDLKFEIHGEKGAIRFSLMNLHYLEFFDATASDKPYGGNSGWTQIACGGRYEIPDSCFPSIKALSGWVRGHIASLSNFMNSVAHNELGDPNLLQGCRIQYLLDAIGRAAQEQKWTRID